MALVITIANICDGGVDDTFHQHQCKTSCKKVDGVRFDRLKFEPKA